MPLPKNDLSAADSPGSSGESGPAELAAPAPAPAVTQTVPSASSDATSVVPSAGIGRGGGEPVETTGMGAEPSPAAGDAVPVLWKAVLATLALVAAGGLVLAWNGQQRLQAVEQELIKRQQDLGERASEARALAQQAEAATRDAASRLAVTEARLAELAVQRTQVDDMLRSIIAAREENLLAEIDSALRVAVQHAAITGSLDPLSSALSQADERLGRTPRPRLELVRLAVAKDLDRVRTAAALDLPGMTVRIDEMVRVVDDLPLIAAIDRRGVRERRPERPRVGQAPQAVDPPPADDTSRFWPEGLGEGVRQALEAVWSEVRNLVRVTRVDDPQAALLAPEQAFFLRENLKLRLLNARLALLSRQFDMARADLSEASGMIDRYFDKSSRRVAAAAEQLRQMASQAVQVLPPRADDTLAALATAMASR